MWEKTKAPLSENGPSMLMQLSTIGISHVLPNDVEPLQAEDQAILRKAQRSVCLLNLFHGLCLKLDCLHM